MLNVSLKAGKGKFKKFIKMEILDGNKLAQVHIPAEDGYALSLCMITLSNKILRKNKKEK